MGECILLKSGGGIRSDDCTARKSNVLSGCTTVTQDSNDEIEAGTMPNREAWTASVVMNGSVAVPQGCHNGNGKVNGPVIADRGAWSTNIGVNDRATIPQGYHNGGGSVGQSIPVQNADVSGTDRALATNMSAWNGTMCSGVRNGHYLNGVNWIQANVPNLTASNIKKGVNIAGLIGTWEGYVANPTDLYYRGDNAGGIVVHSLSYGKFDFADTYIEYTSEVSNNISYLKSSRSYNFAGYNYMYVDFRSLVNRAGGTMIRLYANGTATTGGGGTPIADHNVRDLVVGGSYTAVLNVTNHQTTVTPFFAFSTYQTGNPLVKLQITRIRLST